jgi:hypothetical protein
VIEHTVSQGECLSSISAHYGFTWQTIWEHGLNAELKQLRKDPNVLFPGDVVKIPDRALKEESRGTDARHRFQKKGTPAKLKIRLLLNDKPRPERRYRLCIDGTWIKGQTDGAGFLEVKIPPHARQGELYVEEDGFEDVFQLQLGELDPIDTDEGVVKRLANLGYATTPDLAAGLRSFQHASGLTVTGTLDNATRAKLKEHHGE